MRRGFKHTRISRLVLLLLFFSPATISFAQDAPPVVDTIISQVATTKDSESYFDKMYDGGPVAARSVPDSAIQQLRKDEDYWYVNTAPERQKRKIAETPEGEQWYQKDWFANLLWFLLTGTFVAILIWFLASSNVQLFRKKPAAVNEEGEAVEDENIFSLNYEKEIQKAVAHQNYRLAIRLWYLQTLKELAGRNLIQYKQERTNSDYVHQLYNTSYHKNFFRLTRNFEYAWYGKFEVSADSFALLQKDFQTFKQQLP